MRVVLCGTHPDQTNGYAKVVFQLARGLAACPGVEVHIFAFQSRPTSEPRLRSGLPADVRVFDVREEEIARDVRRTTFGDDLIAEYVREHRPDIVVIYNDFLVVQRLVAAIEPVRVELPAMRVWAYLDLVYQCQNISMVQALSAGLDGAMVFLDHWAKDLRRMGFEKPVEIVPHGVAREQVFRVPQRVARKRFGLSTSSFILLNANRNQPRKRWDVCLLAFAKFVIANPDADAILLIATQLAGAWNVPRTVREMCLFLGADPDPVLERITAVDRPQKLSDSDVCLLYNAADVGINTCDGEGFGLCTFEHASVGAPQIVPDLPTFRAYLDDDCASLISQGAHIHHDSSTAVEGMAFVCDADAVAQAIEGYYRDRDRVADHGRRCMERTRRPEYTWERVTDKMREVLVGAFGG